MTVDSLMFIHLPLLPPIPFNPRHWCVLRMKAVNGANAKAGKCLATHKTKTKQKILLCEGKKIRKN